MLEAQAADDPKPRVPYLRSKALKRVGTGCFVAKGNFLPHRPILFVFRSIRLSFLCLPAVLWFVLSRDKRPLLSSLINSFTQQCRCSFYVRCNLDRLCCSRLVTGRPYRSNKHCRQFHIHQFNLYGEILPNQGGLFVTLC